jgi:hypothetical protein
MPNPKTGKYSLREINMGLDDPIKSIRRRGGDNVGHKDLRNIVESLEKIQRTQEQTTNIIMEINQQLIELRRQG